MSLLNSKSTTDEEMTYSTAHQEEQKLLEKQYTQTVISGRIQSRVMGLMFDGDFDAAKQLFYKQALPSQSNDADA